MKKLLAICAMVAIVLAVSGVAQASYLETFSTDNASWNYGYGNNFSTILPATWVSLGGNPDGYISGASQNLYAVWTYVTAPYGDMTGLSLTIDTKATGADAGNAQFYVGRGGTYFINGFWAIGNDLNWTTHTAALDSTNFTPWTGQNDYFYTLEQVLQTPTDIGIFFGGGLASGTGTLGVDNFGTLSAAVPEPATMFLLGSGLIGLAGFARKRFKK